MHCKGGRSLADSVERGALEREPAKGDTLVRVEDLVKHFPLRGGILSRVKAHVRAVDGVDLEIRKGETLGIVGESGCGKTTLGRMLVHLLTPTRGCIEYRGRTFDELSKRDPRALHRRVQIVFQDPASSLDPRMTIRNTVAEPLVVNRQGRGARLTERVHELLDLVGLKPEHMNRFPHEFSGGQKQRIGIARALALDPEFLVLDEPTSALDVSVQAQVLNLLKDLQDRLGLTYVLISHNLGVVRHMCDRVAIMYLGQIAEQGPVEEVFTNPQHPYTQALLSAIPVPDPHRHRQRILLPGDVPSPVDPPPACRFHPRCPRAQPVCREVAPPLEPKRPLQLAACHFPGPQEQYPVTQGKVQEG